MDPSVGRLDELGFAIAAYPLSLLSAGIKAQQAALESLKTQGSVDSSALVALFGAGCWQV